MINERLKFIRQQIAKSASDFARMNGLEIRTYSSYERGERNPSLDFIEHLVSEYKVNANWLLTGKGSNFLPETKNTFSRQNDENVYEKISQMGRRLQDIQDKHNFLDKEMAILLKISEKEYIKIKLGQSEPNMDTINQIKRNFDVDIDWLLYG